MNPPPPVTNTLPVLDIRRDPSAAESAAAAFVILRSS